MDKLGKEPYKGVRDFYPEEKFRQNFIFNKWQKAAESFGYEEMNASPLEPTELFEAKTGEEIINEQTYTFTDRGGRRVTLRPEMTPTVTRMVAKKKREMSFPVRLYSIANFFRYERPQRGRLREFYQLNCDLFGASGASADFEIVNLAYSIMKEFGVPDSKFEIRINNRKYLNSLFREYFSMDERGIQKISKLVDKKNKISKIEFMEQIKILLGDKTKEFVNILENADLKKLSSLDSFFRENEGLREINSLFEKLQEAGVKNYRYEPSLVRGLDYYTGMVFEIYDTGSKNNRSIYGGGRYDNLLQIFGEEAIPAAGFAIGDVPMSDFLQTYDLFPEYRSSADLFISALKEEFIGAAEKLAQELRKEGVNVAVNLSAKKITGQINQTVKKSIPFILFVGREEIASEKYKIKNLKTGEEKILEKDSLAGFIKK